MRYKVVEIEGLFWAYDSLTMAKWSQAYRTQEEATTKANEWNKEV